MRAPYRSSEGTPSKRRLDADQTIATHEGELGPSSLLVVPAPLRRRVEALRAAGEAASDDERVALAEALEETVAIVRARADDVRALPDGHPAEPELEDRWGPIGTESAAASAVKAVRDAVAALDHAGEVTLTGPRITARFRTRGAPLVWSVHLGGAVSAGGYGAEVQAFTSSSHWMATSTPGDLPEVFLRGETVTDKVLGALHLRPEPKVGDDAFDAAFFLERGDADYLRAVLGPGLRRAMLARSELGGFTCLHRDGEASLAWRTSLGSLVRAEVCAASAEILVAFRVALAGLELLRRPTRDEPT